MKIVIEFYRTRVVDDAHAVVGRELAEVANVESAIEVARQLSQSLDMPQQPDAVTIKDAEGATLYTGSLQG